MKASRFTAEQIVAILHEAAAGSLVSRRPSPTRYHGSQLLSLAPAVRRAPGEGAELEGRVVRALV